MIIQKLEITFDEDVALSDVPQFTKKIVKEIEASMTNYMKNHPSPHKRFVHAGKAFPYWAKIFKKTFPVQSIYYKVKKDG